MSSKGKKRKDAAASTDESDSGSEEVRKKPAKKVASKQENKSEDGITACELSKNRKVIVRQFKSMILVDIREYWGKDGEMKPSKKGISLTVDQWEALRDHVNDVDEVIAELS